jgi:hypothetical protein
MAENLSQIGLRRLSICASSSAFCSVLRSATSSRGRTWRSAMRAVMRSTSLVPLSCARRRCQGPVPPRHHPRRAGAVVAARRWRASVRSRRGSSSQCAASGCPCRSCRCRAARTAWARLRRAGFDQLEVAPRGGGQVDQSSLRCTCTLCTCVSGGPGCARRRPAARRRRRGPGPGPARSRPAGWRRRSCSSSLRSPSALSNCQSGRGAMGQVKAPPGAAPAVAAQSGR